MLSGGHDVTLCRLMSKHQNIVYKTNIDEKKYQKMEVNKFLYFAQANFNLMLFTLWSSILFHDQFTDFLHDCLHPVFANCNISLDWMMSEAFQCYRRKLENGENRWRHAIYIYYQTLTILVIQWMYTFQNIHACYEFTIHVHFTIWYVLMQASSFPYQSRPNSQSSDQIRIPIFIDYLSNNVKSHQKK